MKNIKTIVTAITIIMGLVFFMPAGSFAAGGGSEGGEYSAALWMPVMQV